MSLATPSSWPNASASTRSCAATIHLAGLLHDVGKIGIPDVVLRKPSKLTADEYGMFQQHVVARRRDRA